MWASPFRQRIYSSGVPNSNEHAGRVMRQFEIRWWLEDIARLAE